MDGSSLRCDVRNVSSSLLGTGVLPLTEDIALVKDTGLGACDSSSVLEEVSSQGSFCLGWSTRLDLLDPFLAPSLLPLPLLKYRESAFTDLVLFPLSVDTLPSSLVLGRAFLEFAMA